MIIFHIMGWKKSMRVRANAGLLSAEKAGSEEANSGN